MPARGTTREPSSSLLRRATSMVARGFEDSLPPSSCCSSCSSSNLLRAPSVVATPSPRSALGTVPSASRFFHPDTSQEAGSTHSSFRCNCAWLYWWGRYLKLCRMNKRPSPSANRSATVAHPLFQTYRITPQWHTPGGDPVQSGKSEHVPTVACHTLVARQVYSSILC
jgi:hypothetical protein